MDRSEGKGKIKLCAVSLGLGLSSLNYQDARIADYKALATTLKASVAKLPDPLLPGSWDYSASGYFTLIPLRENMAETARFLGINLRAGRPLQDSSAIQRTFLFGLSGGIYYTTTFVTDDKFGFKDMAGPQLYPTMSVRLGSGIFFRSYAKFSPVTDGLSVISLRNHERAAGFSVSRADILTLRTMAATFDASAMQLSLGGVSIRTSSYTLGFSVSL